jgi:outer membrane protein assembly factor BamB
MKNRHSRKLRIIFFAFLSVGCINKTDTSGSWSDWRGNNRDGIWRNNTVSPHINENNIEKRWKASVGNGYSGPTLYEGKVFLTDKPDNETERVVCFDEQSGEMLWEHTYRCAYSIGYPNGPRASVIIKNNKAYSLGAMGNLFCFNANNGDVIWEKKLNEEYNIRMPIWGISAAPLIYKNLLILQIGGSNNSCVVALDRITGKKAWNALDDKASYSPPKLIKQAGKDVVVVWTGEAINALDPEKGTLYWSVNFNQKMEMAISDPVVFGNRLFVSSFFDGSMMLELAENQLTADTLWYRAGKNERMTDALHCCINTPIMNENNIFGVCSYGQLRCLDASNGDRIWVDTTVVAKNRWANVHFIQNREYVWMFNEEGQLITAEFKEKGYHEIGRVKIIEPTTGQLNRKGEGVTWAFPAFANNHIFVRSDSELICYKLPEK